MPRARAWAIGEALGLAAVNPLWWRCDLGSGRRSRVGPAAAGQAADCSDRHIVIAQSLTGQPDPAHALGREHVSLGDGHPLGFPLDEFDAAGRAPGIAPAGVQDIHPSILLNGQHETLPIGNVKRAKTFNGQSRHRLPIIPEAMIGHRPAHGARSTKHVAPSPTGARAGRRSCRTRRLNLPGARERGLDVRADVLLADVLVELRRLHQRRRLFPSRRTAPASGRIPAARRRRPPARECRSHRSPSCCAAAR